MSSSFLWVKAFHIVFVASWFAGLFYLPRVFVNLAMVPADSVAERARLLLMARKLYRFAGLLMGPGLVIGLLLCLVFGVGRGPGNGWLYAKVSLVLAAVGYNFRLLLKWLAPVCAWFMVLLATAPSRSSRLQPA